MPQVESGGIRWGFLEMQDPHLLYLRKISQRAPQGCRRGRPGAWERGGRWLPFPGCRQLAVAMASVCFPFLPALERKARVAACLFLNYKKVEKGLTCAAVPASRFGATANVAICCSDQCLGGGQCHPPLAGAEQPVNGFWGVSCTPHLSCCAHSCKSSLHQHACCLSCLAKPDGGLEKGSST